MPVCPGPGMQRHRQPTVHARMSTLRLCGADKLHQHTGGLAARSLPPGLLLSKDMELTSSPLFNTVTTLLGHSHSRGSQGDLGQVFTGQPNLWSPKCPVTTPSAHMLAAGHRTCLYTRHPLTGAAGICHHQSSIVHIRTGPRCPEVLSRQTAASLWPFSQGWHAVVSLL